MTHTTTTEEFIHFVKDHTLAWPDVFFTMNALAGELGELANVVKKEEYYNRLPLYAARVDEEIEAGTRNTYRHDTVDEAGDVLFYLVQLLNKKGISMEEVMSAQMKKVNDQYKEFNKVFKK